MASKMDAASKSRSMKADTHVVKYYRYKITKTMLETIQFAFDSSY
jgi:exocyst complex component 3